MTSERERQIEQRSSRNAKRLQLLLWALEEWMYQEQLEGMTMDSVTVRHGRDRGGDVLVILKARMEGKAWVAFHSAATPEDALRGALERIRNNDAKWREDKPYEG